MLLSIDGGGRVCLRAAFFIVLEPFVGDLSGLPADAMHGPVGLHFQQYNPIDVLGKLAFLKGKHLDIEMLTYDEAFIICTPANLLIIIGL